MGKRFSPDEVAGVLDPMLTGLGLQRPTDMTQPPEQRTVPTTGAIVAALPKQYGSALKHYSDLKCLHAL